jgi:hypothetical protein
LGVAAVALSNGNLFAAAIAAQGSGPVNPLLSVGFASALPASGNSVRLSAADALLMPDPLFISRGARVTVAGSARYRGQQGQRGGLALHAVFAIRSRVPEAYPRFSFWSVSGRQEGDSISGPTSFVVPVPATSGLTLIAERTLPSSDKPLSTPPPLGADIGTLTLSLLSGVGPKLQRGVYVIALRETPSEMPADWSRFSLANDHGAYRVTGDAFSYVILDIDYADEVPTRRRAAAH